MKLILTMEEARSIIRRSVRAGAVDMFAVADDADVMFVHRCSDGSGEIDAETIVRIDRVEIELGEPIKQ